MRLAERYATLAPSFRHDVANTWFTSDEAIVFTAILYGLCQPSMPAGPSSHTAGSVASPLLKFLQT